MSTKSEADLWAWYRDGMHRELRDLEKRRALIQTRATTWIIAAVTLIVLAYVFPAALHLPRRIFVPAGVLVVLGSFWKRSYTVELVLGGLGLIFWSLWADFDWAVNNPAPNMLTRLLPDGTLFPAVLAAIVGTVDVKHRMREFRTEFKGRVIRALVRFIDESWTFTPNGFVSKSDVYASGLVPENVTRVRGEDMVRGAIGKTHFASSELNAQRREVFRDRSGVERKRWVTVFSGLMFACHYNRPFAHEVFVLPDTAERLLGYVGTALQSWKSSHGELIKLEDPIFEKYFAVYGSDQIAARTVLTPAVMEQMVAFRERTGTGVSMSIRQGRFFAAVPLPRNLFEPPLFRSIAKFSELRTYFDDLMIFTELALVIDKATRRWQDTKGLSELNT